MCLFSGLLATVGYHTFACPLREKMKSWPLAADNFAVASLADTEVPLPSHHTCRARKIVDDM